MEVQNSLVGLASGVDALYLTGKCTVPADLFDALESARAVAGERREEVPLRVGGEVFRVGWGPLNRWRFRLLHRHALVGMSTSSSIPGLYVQPTAEFIHAVGVDGVMDWCVSTFGRALGWIDWQVSRVDLFADVQGWGVSADDRRDFVARAKARRTYEQDDDLTGLQWGEGGAIMCRIYDKTRESANKGTDWWPSVWGEAFDPTKRVVRVEFQVRRDALREFSLNSPADVLASRRVLWEHLTGKWLSLREPSAADSNRSRWPVAEPWSFIQAADLNGAPVGEELVRRGSEAGGIRRLVPALVGYATKAGALKDVSDADELMVCLRRLFERDASERGLSIESRLTMQRQRLGLA